MLEISSTDLSAQGGFEDVGLRLGTQIHADKINLSPKKITMWAYPFGNAQGCEPDEKAALLTNCSYAITLNLSPEN